MKFRYGHTLVHRQLVFQQTSQPILSSCMILWSSLCTVMHSTVALLAATGAAPLKPQQQPLVQQNDPCLRGDMANRCTSAGPLEGQLQITCQLLSLLDVHQRQR